MPLSGAVGDAAEDCAVGAGDGVGVVAWCDGEVVDAEGDEGVAVGGDEDVAAADAVEAESAGGVEPGAGEAAARVSRHGRAPAS